MASIKGSETSRLPTLPGTSVPYFSTPAFALHAIPISYALSLPPQIYMFTKMMTASKYTASNLVPRANLERLASTLPKATLDTLWKAHGCNLNALEGFPLFAAAMLAGSYTKMDTKELNFCAAEYLAVRVLYSVLYLTAQSEKASYLRTAVYTWSVGIPFYVLWKAGWKVAKGDQEEGKDL